MMNEKKKNPFQDKDGGPVKDKETEFFKWARNNEMEHRKTLSKEKQDSLKKSDTNLKNKMLS